MNICPDCDRGSGQYEDDGVLVSCRVCAGTGRISDALARKLTRIYGRELETNEESSSRIFTPRIHAMQKLGRMFVVDQKDLDRLPAPSGLDITFMNIADKHGIDISMPWDEDGDDY